MAVTLVVFAAEVVAHPLPDSISAVFQKFASCALFFGAAALALHRAITCADERGPWMLLAAAMALWGAGALYFAVFLWDRETVPYPSVADGLWLLFYVPAFAALIAFLRGNADDQPGLWLDGLVGGLGVGGAAAALSFDIVLENTDGSGLATATNLAYPAADVALLSLVVVAVIVTGWKGAGTWRWIGAAFLVFAIADSVYLVEVAHGGYAPGDLVDVGWPLAALLVGIAAVQPEAAAEQRPTPRLAFAVSAVFALAALLLLVVDHFARTNLLALCLATASLLVMLFRLALTVRDNVRMLEQSREEAATDPLTGLGNRRRLTADLQQRIAGLDPAQPLMLTLFDLDGFKQYNDTFGHPAGDQLLERLGARLATVLADRGTAYRMGGDEFCALWSLAGPDQASVAAIEAVAALSERGEAFDIGCSYGSVLLPNETSDPIDALRMADRRMYMRKRGGRASAGRQSSDVLLRALSERDAELGDHISIVADLACATAKALGIPQDELEDVRQTALLHDVGKVAIPDAILSKEAPLDADEWEFMKRHTLIGERILSAAPALTSVARYVRSSHERFDGNGYPDGLTAEETPLISRIVAVCDAYDAMVTDRPYQPPLAPDVALAELRRCAGTQFDPAVVEAFSSALSRAASSA